MKVSDCAGALDGRTFVLFFIIINILFTIKPYYNTALGCGIQARLIDFIRLYICY